MPFMLALPERAPAGPAEAPAPLQESLRAALLRVVDEQIGNALGQVSLATGPAIDSDASAEAIHSARKSLKRLRSTFRLLRRALEKAYFQLAQIGFGDVARNLAETREADALDEALCHLGRACSAEPASPSPAALVAPALCRPEYVQAVAAAVTARAAHSQASAARLPQDVRDSVLAELTEARSLIPTWTLRGRLDRALERGLRRAARQARKAVATAFSASDEAETVERLHDLRKRVKDLFYMCTLLSPAEPAYLQELTAQLDTLADYLGDDHDLAMLAAQARRQPLAFAGDANVAVLLQLGSERQRVLRYAARQLAEALLVPIKPRLFARRVLAGLVAAFRGPPPAAGADDRMEEGG